MSLGSSRISLAALEPKSLGLTSRNVRTQDARMTEAAGDRALGQSECLREYGREKLSELY